MNPLILILRLVHITAGAFWVGGSVLTTFFVDPAASATGEAGQKFFGHLVRKAKLSQRFAVAAGFTVLAGGWLYWIDSAGLSSDWMRSGPGWGFGIGAVLALIGFVFGIRVGALTRRIGSLVSAIHGTPTQAQMHRLRLIQDPLLILALACMATARYWRF
jgi:uncharacterized membrane protein